MAIAANRRQLGDVHDVEQEVTDARAMITVRASVATAHAGEALRSENQEIVVVRGDCVFLPDVFP